MSGVESVDALDNGMQYCLQMWLRHQLPPRHVRLERGVDVFPAHLGRCYVEIFGGRILGAQHNCSRYDVVVCRIAGAETRRVEVFKMN